RPGRVRPDVIPKWGLLPGRSRLRSPADGKHFGHGYRGVRRLHGLCRAGLHVEVEEALARSPHRTPAPATAIRPEARLAARVTCRRTRMHGANCGGAAA